MLRLAVLAILFAVVCAVPIDNGTKSVDDFLIDHNIIGYLVQNSEFELQELKEEEIQGDHALKYTLGARVNGDRLVAVRTLNQQFSSAQNARVKQEYVGVYVTHVLVVIHQSSRLGRIRVLAGGIGRRHITYLVEAHQTRYIRYRAEIYGRFSLN